MQQEEGDSLSLSLSATPGILSTPIVKDLETWLQENRFHRTVYPRLLELGITSLSQILGSSSEQIAAISEKLSGASRFKFRIICGNLK